MIHHKTADSDLETRPTNAARYALLRALDLTARGLAPDGLEGEIHQELAYRSERIVRGFLVPLDLPVQAEDPTTHVWDGRTADRPFDAHLRKHLITAGLGATVLTDLRADCGLPRPKSGVPADGPMEQAPLTSAPVSVAMDVPRSLLAQRSRAAEARLVTDLAAGLAAVLDQAALAGPSGILGDAQVPLLEFGPDGGEPTYDLLARAEQTIGEAADGRYTAGWVTTPAGRSKLRRTFLKDDSDNSLGYPLWIQDTLLDRRALATEALPSNLTKGAGAGLSALVFGRWSDLIVSLWGNALELIVDPQTFADQGLVRLTAVLGATTTVRRPASFVRVLDLVTN